MTRGNVTLDSDENGRQASTECADKGSADKGKAAWVKGGRRDWERYVCGGRGRSVWSVSQSVSQLMG